MLNEIESDVSHSGLIQKTTNNEILQNLISEPEEENSKANAKTILHKFLKEKSSEIEQKTAIYYESVVDLMTEILRQTDEFNHEKRCSQMQRDISAITSEQK